MSGAGSWCAWLLALTLGGCAHVPRPVTADGAGATAAATGDASTSSLLAAGAGRAPVLVILHPARLAASRAVLPAVLAMLEPPRTLAAAAGTGDASRIAGALLAALAPEGRDPPAGLAGLDVNRPILLALAEPVRSSSIAAAIHLALGESTFALRHRIVLPATDPSRLLASIDGIFPVQLPPQGRAHVYPSKVGVGTIAASPMSSAVVLTFLAPRLTPEDRIAFDAGRQPATGLPRQVSQALLAPVDSVPDLSDPALRMLVTPGAAAAATVRMDMVWGALLAWDAAMVRSLMPIVAPEFRRRITAEGMYEALLAWVVSAPEAVEIPAFGFTLDLEPVLRLRAVATLSELGQRAFAAGTREGVSVLPTIKDALWSAAIQLDTAALISAVPDLVPGRTDSERQLPVQLFGSPQGLFSLASRPAAWARELAQKAGMLSGAPHGIAVSLAELRPGVGGPHPVGSLTLLLPPDRQSSAVGELMLAMANELNHSGDDARLTMRRASISDGDRRSLLELTVALEPDSPTVFETSAGGPGSFAQVHARPASLARQLFAAGVRAPMLTLAERYETLRAGWRLDDNVLVGELAAVPPGVSDSVPPFAPQARRAPVVASGAGVRCLRRAVEGLRPAFAAVAAVDSPAIGAVLDQARKQVHSALACAAQDPATREDVNAIESLLQYLAGPDGATH